METQSQFTGRYKKDLSTENLRLKVIRRKTITQKENRHNEFKKSRGLSVTNGNISILKEYDLPVLDETTEQSFSKGHEHKTGSSKALQQMSNERFQMLQRFKEEKLLRKLKEQRDKNGKGAFKCGIYKQDAFFAVSQTSHDAVNAKPKEKVAPAITRVTRSMAKTEALNTSTRHHPVKNFNHNKTVVEQQKQVPKGNVAKPKKTAKDILKPKEVVTVEPRIVAAAKVTKPGNEEACKQTSVERDAPVEAPVARERKPSFAPLNFVFQPLDGLSSYKLKPMSPCRANTFLAPYFTFSPVQLERVSALNRCVPSGLSPELVTQVPNETLEPPMAEKVCETEERLAASSDAVPPCSPTIETIVPKEETEPAHTEEPKHDVAYFRNTMQLESEKLTLLCSRWNEKIEMDIPEDAKDLIRTTVGQTRLLKTERFKQFEGLVDNCEFKRGEKETTCTDLDGFWDMIYFQIEDVIKKFNNLEKLEENSWKPNDAETKKVVKKKIAPAVKRTQDNNGRAAARSRLAFIKAAMKNKGNAIDPVPEVTVPEPQTPVDKIVFDAVFFRVESPAKLKNGVRSSRRSSQISATPNSTTRTLQESIDAPAISVTEDECVPFPDSPVAAKSPAERKLFEEPEEESVQKTEKSLQSSHIDSNEPDHVNSAPLRFDAVVSTNDLIVFSPM
ncbi:disks large-associated protein 5 [Pelodytes ibericus]